jgi:hypothetical protein
MKSKENNHERAINYLLTGYLPLSTLEFPSIGAVNPALTAMANAIRVGDHLLERLGA